ncbi:hypothetical protein VTJ04DRAFT_10003 [Mycothermus thermophilus]|uniref:uncharacterized protein n=1 Tax=Humicola insolens TaxID=85995 RepID=UPI003743D6A5
MGPWILAEVGLFFGSTADPPADVIPSRNDDISYLHLICLTSDSLCARKAELALDLSPSYSILGHNAWTSEVKPLRLPIRNGHRIEAQSQRANLTAELMLSMYVHSALITFPLSTRNDSRC